MENPLVALHSAFGQVRKLSSLKEVVDGLVSADAGKGSAISGKSGIDRKRAPIVEYMNAERRTSREDRFLMLAACVLVSLLLVGGLAAYILYLTPNPKDPI